MYFTGRIQMDPLTPVIVNTPTPSTLWNRIFQTLTGQKPRGLETETFTALEILRQLHGLLRSLGISDVLRLSVDSEVLYEDLQGRTDDRDQAFMDALQKLDPLAAEVFGVLHLSLLHHHKDMELLLDITLRREHPLGEYPLEIQVRGKSDEGLETQATGFRDFLKHLDFCLRKYFQVADSRITEDVDQVLGEVVEPLVVEVMEDAPEGEFFTLAQSLLKEFRLDPGTTVFQKEFSFGGSTTIKTTRTTIIQK